LKIARVDYLEKFQKQAEEALQELQASLAHVTRVTALGELKLTGVRRVDANTGIPDLNHIEAHGGRIWASPNAGPGTNSSI
jgi:hypothetical protein